MYLGKTLLRMHRHVIAITSLGCLLTSGAGVVSAQAVQAGGSPRPGTVAAGAQKVNQRASSSRVGRVRGRLISADTQGPLGNVDIELRPAIPNGKAEVIKGSTDAGGIFEFIALAPGRYILSALQPGYAQTAYGRRTGQAVMVMKDAGQSDMEVRLHRLGAVEGDVAGPDNLPVAGATVTLSQFRTDGGRRMLVPQRVGKADDRGHFRLFDVPGGKYLLSAVPPPVTTSGNRGKASAHTYFPGVLAAREASQLQIAKGQEVRSIYLQLKESANLAISGTVAGPAGSKAAGFTVTAIQEPTESGVVFLDRVSQKSDGQGNFKISGLAPGRYRLLVRGTAQGRTYGAMAAAELDNGDLANVNIAVGEGAEVTGKIVFEGSPFPLNPKVVHLSLKPELELGGLSRARIEADSTFAIKGIPEGPARFAVLLPTNRFYVKAIRLNGQDVADQLVNFANGAQFNDVEVVLSFDGAHVTGVLQGGAGGNSWDSAAVILFPMNQELWRTSPRLIKVAYPTPARRFTASGIMPGEYGIVALNGVALANGIDSALLAEILPLAKRVELHTNETRAEVLHAAQAPAGWRE